MALSWHFLSSLKAGSVLPLPDQYQYQSQTLLARLFQLLELAIGDIITLMVPARK